METIDCPLCGAQDRSLFMKSIDIKRTREVFTIVECTRCSFKYTNPRPSFEEIGAYYGESYYSYQQPDMKPIKDSKNGLKFLDYGCGAGHVMLEKAQKGYKVYGIEIDDNAIDRGRALGLTIKKAQKKGIDFPDDYFDVIHVNHVLEHIHELQSVMSEFYRCLKTGGKMWIEVPNIGSYDAQIHGAFWNCLGLPVHLYQFEPKSLNRLLRQAGFCNYEIKTANIPAFKKGMPYLKSRYTVFQIRQALQGRGDPWNLMANLLFVAKNFFRYSFHKKSFYDGNLLQALVTK